MRDFRLAGVGLPAQRKAQFKTAMLELSQLQAKFEENVLDATNGWSWHVTDVGELRGLNDMLIEQARRRAAEQRVAGWTLALDQPTYVAVVTDAQSPGLRRAFYEAWTTRASDQGPNARRWDNSAVMEEILKRRHEAARLLDFWMHRSAATTRQPSAASAATVAAPMPRAAPVTSATRSITAVPWPGPRPAPPAAR